jgi:hypothetical protein
MSEPNLDMLPVITPPSDFEYAEFTKLKHEIKKRWGRVTAYRVFLALRANRWHAFSPEELRHLHPGGKIGVPGTLLTKPCETCAIMREEIDAELARRKGDKA